MFDWAIVADWLWGDGEMLGAVAMSARAFVMFFVVLAQIRFAGSRSFGHKSSFDNVVVIMLGAIAARGVVGASPFGSTVVACAMVVVLHRILGRLCANSRRLAHLVEGKRVSLYRAGRLQRNNMKKTNLSEGDLLESHRLETQTAELSPHEEAFLERNGRISFVRREDENRH